MEIQERGTFIKRMNAGEVPFFPWGWTADYPDAMYFLSQVWYGPSPFNRARWKNAEFDQLIDRAQGTADAPGAVQGSIITAEQVLLSDWGTCPLVVRMQIALRKPNVQGVRLDAVPVPAVQHRDDQLRARAGRRARRARRRCGPARRVSAAGGGLR